MDKISYSKVCWVHDTYVSWPQESHTYSICSQTHNNLADLFNMFFVIYLTCMRGAKISISFAISKTECSVWITVIAISSLWITLSYFHPLQKLFITQIKWRKGILFALEILQSFIHTNAKLLNRTGVQMYAEVWRLHINVWV